ncbi:P22AR C-terminal domain-containing protein [Avibacterium paragallinarum]|uniref:Prophage antirepressor protein n=1 Tax=Avibacterium paragallinarum TaxID=728 RepID=A0A377IAC2_AVIPA|nr:P22AR C-terminal domain-containing protein [Avibacterium paragallinarum]POY44956.1 hypothetical protein C3364_12935 [Avibacterium paragallinarum]RZN54111.1 hypothetical protein EIG79_11995 [Avibacterium paragallinarum]RZN77833.1 hypothetical protein EC523_01625 [Avibacterium paragallinarum]CDF97885.1 Putative Possible bacteriophage antirepressor [Avibacterium paragallinarum JF4211]STO72255.1 Putative prophage antirepressor protein [Avibacterium paragallinarum]
MSNQLFNFNSSPVRIEIFDNQPFFCLLDVCRIFQIQNSRRVQSQMLDPQGVRLAYALAKDEKQRKTAFINEPNLYRIIFRSEKPIAKSFQNWVFEEVLPQIRKTGKYSLQNQQLALPEPEKKYTFEFTEYELEQLAWLWFSHKRMNTLLAELYAPLNAIGSTYSGAVYSHAYEYKRHYEESQATLQRLTQPFTQSKKLNWQRVIPKINPTKKLLDF